MGSGGGLMRRRADLDGWIDREDVECARLAEEEKGGGEGELTI